MVSKINKIKCTLCTLCVHSFISLGTLVSWKPPTDGACYDKSCLCYNQLGALEIAITAVIVTIGIVVSIVLMIFNVAMRSNK